MIRCCLYCDGLHDGPWHKRSCSGSCKARVSRAKKMRDLLPLGSKQRQGGSSSPERLAATGWGTMTELEGYQADLRIRFAAGLEPRRRPYFLPGGHPDVFCKATWIIGRA